MMQRNQRFEKRDRPDRHERKPQQFELNIQRWGINGEGIGYLFRKPVFVPGAVPGETVKVEIEKETDKFMTARLLEVRKASTRRQQSPCAHWQECGGCSLIHVDYKGQLQMKMQYLTESLKKYADYTGPIEPMIKNPAVFGYRNACKLPAATVDGRLETGMFKRDSNEFVPVSECPIHSKVLESTRKEIMDILRENDVKAYNRNHRGGLKMLVMKEFGSKVQVILVTDPMDLPPRAVKAISDLPQVVSLWQSIKTERDSDLEVFGKVLRHLAGEEKIGLDLGPYKLQLLPRSFFQLNTAQAEKLYEVVRDMTPESNLLVEAYSGIGGISLYVHDKAKEVIGIEEVADAVTNAAENAEANGVENVRFVCGDAAEELENIGDDRDIDTLVVDPPRSGLGERMIDAIQFCMPEYIVYVSCNPSTLAKDLGELAGDYEIEKVQPLDMFSQTSNVECIVRLKRIPEEA